MKAAVLEKIGQPLSVVEIANPLPGIHYGESCEILSRGQVLIKMLCAGICGAQLQEIDGLKGNPAHCPHLLGHEGCGIVVGIRGDSSITIKRGDKVVVHWRKGTVGMDVEGPRFKEVKAGPCTTFSEYTVVSENRVTVIPEDVPNDFASLLGCCLSTALALVENEAELKGYEDVTIIGCGGLGLALVVAAKLRTCGTITGIDRALEKLKLVEELGARFSSELKLSSANSVIIDTVENNPVPCLKYISLQKGGTEGGGFNPTKDIPRYVQMWRDGKLNGWEKLITHRISLEKINEGIQLMRDGKAGRVLIEFT